MGVILQRPDGVNVEVDEGAAAEALSRGYKVVTPEARFEKAATESAAPQGSGGITGGLNASLTSALSGLTFGGSDAALTALMDKGQRERLAADRAAHPTASFISNIAGAVAPAIVTGGESAGVSAGELGTEAALGETVAANSPSALAFRGGSALRAAIGTETLGARIVGGAAEGAVLGATQSAGNYVSDVALGNRDLSAEAFLAEVGNGAKWGGIAGGSLTAAGRGLIAAKRLFPRAEMTAVAADGAMRDATSQLASATNVGDQAAQAARDYAARIRGDAAIGVASAGEQSVALRTEQAAQQAETASARGAAAGEPAVDDALARQGAAADVHADAAHAAIDSDARFAAKSTEQRAQDLEKLAARVESDGDKVRQLLKMQAVESDAAEAFRVPPANTKLAGLYETAVNRAAATVGGEQVRWLVAAEHAEKSMFDEALAAGGARAESAQSILDARASAGIDAQTAIQRRIEKLGTHEYESAIDQAHQGMQDASLKSAAKPDASLEDLLAGTKTQMDRGAAFGDIKPGEAAPGGFSEADVPQEALLSDRFRTMGEKPPIWAVDTNKAAEVIGGYEKSVADLTKMLGPAAPPEALAIAEGYDAAASKVDANQTRSIADAIDDSHAQVSTAEEHAAAREQLGKSLGVSEMVAPGELDNPMVGEPKPAAMTRKPGILGKLAGAGKTLEAARMMGIPLIPSVSAIPVVGPLLSMFLKAKLLKTFLGKADGMMPETIEARVAAHGAALRNKIAKGVDAALAGGKQAAERYAPEAKDALDHRMFDALEKPGAKSDGDLRELAAKRAQELADAATKPDAMARELRMLVPTGDSALFDSMNGVLQRKIAYLQQAAPPLPPPDPFGRQPPPISTAAAEKFARVVRAAEHPLSILDDFRDGTLTAQSVECVKTIYPNLYALIQQRVLSTAVAQGVEVPYRTRVRASVLFNAPLDASIAKIGALQKAAPAASSPTTQPPTPSVANAPNLSKLYDPSPGRRSSL